MPSARTLLVDEGADDDNSWAIAPECFSGRVSVRPKNAGAATVDTPRTPTVRHLADNASSANGTVESPFFGTGIVDLLVLSVSLARHPKLALQACVGRHGTCWPSSAGHGTSRSARSEMGFNRRIDRDVLRLCPATANDWYHDCLTSPLAAFLPRSLFPPVGVSNPERLIPARVATAQNPLPALDGLLLP